jgi:glycosyltransferase involved in cell wall biosynthesis
MNILLVSDVYPPIIGGAELQTQLLAKKLTQRGHTVNVATSWQVGFAEHEIDDNVPVHRVKGLSSLVPWFSTNPARRHHPPLPDPAAVVALRRIIDQVKPDVIHVYGWIIYSVAAALTGRDIPLVIAMREYANMCALRSLLQNGTTPCSGPALGKCVKCASTFFGAPKGLVSVAGVRLGKLMLRRKVRGVHSISGFMRHIAWRDIFATNNPEGTPQPGKGNRVVADSIIPSFRDDLGEQKKADPATIAKYLALLPDKPFIMFVGALRKVKGLDALLAAYDKLNNRPPLVLVGVPAPDTPTSFPDSVTVVHNFPHAAVMAAFERSLFGVFPSLWPEPFGNVVHEAMSRARPAIGTTPGGHTDIIADGETGFLVKPGDVDQLARAMQQLIDSPELCQRMGAAAKERSLLFSSDVVLPQFERFFEEVVARS